MWILNKIDSALPNKSADKHFLLIQWFTKFFKTKYKFPCLLITILLFSASWFYCCLPLDLGKVLSFLWDLYMAAVYWANKTEWSNKTKQNRLSLLPDGTYFVQRNSGMKPIACIHVFTTILHLKKTNLATLSGPSFKPCSSISSATSKLPI